VLVALSTLALCSSAAFAQLLMSTVAYTILFLFLLLLIAGIKPPLPWSSNATSDDLEKNLAAIDSINK
jgi:hypothetical protein